MPNLYFVLHLIIRIYSLHKLQTYLPTSILVLCNNPKKYAVVEPEGRILGQKCVDIVVRHVAVSPVAVQQTDKFRIHIYDSASSDAEVAGKRDILATLHPGRQMPASGCSNPKTKYTSCDRSKGSRLNLNSLGLLGNLVIEINNNHQLQNVDSNGLH